MATKTSRKAAQFEAARKQKSAAEIAAGAPEEKKEEPKKTTAKGGKVEKKQPAEKSGEIKGVSFRLPVETIEKLKDLCNLTGRTATGWITSAIEEAHELRAADIAALKKLQAK